MPSKCAECSKVMESDLSTIALHYKDKHGYEIPVAVSAAKVALKGSAR